MPSTTFVPAAVYRPWPKWVRRLGWSVLGVLSVLVFVYVITITFGGVHGTEFCPETFERRSFSYFQLPLVHIQITGENQADASGATETLVLANNYVTPAPSPKQQWHIVTSGHGAVTHTGEAQILMQYLDAKTNDNFHRWAKWSEDHAAAAQVLWPAVQRLAEQKRYLEIPDLFDLAKRIDDPAELQAEVDRAVDGRVDSGQ